MKKSFIILAVIVVIIVIGIVAWMSYNVPTPAQVPTASTTATDQTSMATSSADMGVLALNASVDSTLGSFIVAPNGMTLYTYSPDAPGVSNCTGTCAKLWPPYTASSSSLYGGTGVSGSISTLTRTDDGTMQVTYNGAPLYYYVKDMKPGDVIGQGVGGVWYVAKP